MTTQLQLIYIIIIIIIILILKHPQPTFHLQCERLLHNRQNYSSVTDANKKTP